MSIQPNNIGRQAFFYRKESTQQVWPPEIPQPEDSQNIEEQNIFTEVPKQPSIKETQSADVSHSMPGIVVQCFRGFPSVTPTGGSASTMLFSSCQGHAVKRCPVVSASLGHAHTDQKGMDTLPCRIFPHPAHSIFQTKISLDSLSSGSHAFLKHQSF